MPETATAPMHELVLWNESVGRIHADKVDQGIQDWMRHGVGILPPSVPAATTAIEAPVTVSGTAIDKATNRDEREKFLVGRTRRTVRA